ncbi:MAG: TPM domain-containing protein [Ferruginibacter sp.]
MNRYSSKIFIKIPLAFCLMLTVLLCRAQNFNPDDLLQAPPKGVSKLVNDYTHTLTQDQEQALEQKLVTLDDSSFTQIAVVIIPTTGGRTISEYNQQLGRVWGVGGKEFNNGVVLLIAKEDHKLDIAVGYGLEGALTDYTAKQIIDDIIVPRFKGDDYYRGIDDGVDAIIAAVKGEYNTPREKGGSGISIFQIILIIILIIVFLSIFSGGNKGGTFMSRRGSGPIIWPTGGGGGWSGGGGGSGWSGGGGGGGFGGFGGGSFGGGGASGSW